MDNDAKGARGERGGLSDVSGMDTQEGSPNSDHEELAKTLPEGTSAQVRALPEVPTPAGVGGEHGLGSDGESEGDDDDDEVLVLKQRDSFLPRLPGLVGTPWAWGLPRLHGGTSSAEAKAERTRQVIMRMLDRSERQQVLFLWRLNATRAKASALAVWAVDQGNRKAYEVERSLMAENSWATRSIIWEGYQHSPLVGVSDSCWFWTAKMDDGISMERLREELKMARQRTAFLASQLDSARQQLIDWQEVADFQSMDGTWQSMRLRESERQLRAARAEHFDGRDRERLRSSEAGALDSPISDSRKVLEERRSNLHSWMMGYQSDREIRSTIPGLSRDSARSAARKSLATETGNAPSSARASSTFTPRPEQSNGISSARKAGRAVSSVDSSTTGRNREAQVHVTTGGLAGEERERETVRVCGDAQGDYAFETREFCDEAMRQLLASAVANGEHKTASR